MDHGNRQTRRFWLSMITSLALAGCNDDDAPPPKNGDPLPRFSAPTVRGGTGSFPSPEAEGKVVIVQFWATWCPQCLGELAALQRLWREADRDRILLQTVESGTDAQTVAKFLARQSFDFPVLLDPRMKIFHRLGLTGLPATLLVDRRGRLRQRFLGEANVADLRKTVARLASENFPS
jgi:peroxiredoxin